MAPVGDETAGLTVFGRPRGSGQNSPVVAEAPKTVSGSRGFAATGRLPTGVAYVGRTGWRPRPVARAGGATSRAARTGRGVPVIEASLTSVEREQVVPELELVRTLPERQELERRVVVEYPDPVAMGQSPVFEQA